MSRPASPKPIFPTERKQFSRRLFAWYKRNGRHDLPWRKTADPYKIFVSEMILQQTQVLRVIPKYRAFIRRFPNVCALAAAEPAAVLRLWSGLGYNRRALYLQRAARAIVTQHAGTFPQSVVALRQLPGVGEYTAAAICIFAWNQNVAAVDTNIRRILIHELRLPETVTAARLQAVAQQLVPNGKSRAWHSALMDYGSAVATARATGVRPRSRQSTFAGSDRYYRGQLIKLLLQHRQLRMQRAAVLLTLPLARCRRIVQQLCADGLVVAAGQRIRLCSRIDKTDNSG